MWFMEGKSTVDQIHSLRQILEKTKEYRIGTFVVLENATSGMGSIINEENTNFILVRTRKQDVQSIRISNYTFKGVT